MENNNKNSLLCQPLWELTLLSVLSFGLYYFYWFYLNWKFMKETGKVKINPIWLTIPLFFPVFNFFIPYFLFKNIYSFLNPKDKNIINHLKALMITFTFVWIYTYYYQPMPYKVLAYFAFIPILIVQFSVNKFYKEVEINEQQT